MTGRDASCVCLIILRETSPCILFSREYSKFLDRETAT